MPSFTAPPFANVEAESIPTPPVAESEMQVGDSKATAETKAETKAKTKAKTKAETKAETKKNTILIDSEKIKTVIANVKTKSYIEMATMTGLTKHQVNRILQTLKSGMRQKAVNENPEAYKTKISKTGKSTFDYTEPLTDFAKKIETKIKEQLCRPEGEGKNKGSGGGKTKKSLDNALDDLLADL